MKEEVVLKFQGKKVLLTRPKGQEESIKQKLEASGASVIHIPLIEIVDPSDAYQALDEGLAAFFQYHWILFTSQNAVKRFFSRPRAPVGSDLACRVAAVGPETAQLLLDLDVQDVVVAEKQSAEGLLETLEGYSFEGKRVLFPRAKEGRDLLAEGLRARGGFVDVVEVYQTLFPKNFDHDSFLKIVQEEKIDIVYFASPSAVKHFMQIVLDAGLQEIMCRFEFLAIGSTTKSALRDYGIEATFFE